MESTPSTPRSTDQPPPPQNPQPPFPTAAFSASLPVSTTMAATHLAVCPFLSAAAPIFFLAHTVTPPSFAQQSQVRQPMQEMQGIGMTGALGTTSSVRPFTRVPAQQFRPSHSPQRAQIIPNSQSPASQSPSSVQGTQIQNQPWLSSGTQGKPPLPSPSIRPQAIPQSIQQRPLITQQHHNIPTTSHKQTSNSGQQVAQPSAPGQQQEHHGQQLLSSRIQPPSSHDSHQQLTKSPGLGGQRLPLGMTQSGALQTAVLLKTATLETEEIPNRFVSKRSIQELVNQIDLSEKLDHEVEDILVDLAEDFVESITPFGCSLAKHRKSPTLEAKDLLLYLESNWNMTIPGYGGDEIRAYKKPIKKSIVAPAAQSAGKSHMAKAPSNIIDSPPKPKMRETA